jgi:hypothetical protein
MEMPVMRTTNTRSAVRIPGAVIAATLLATFSQTALAQGTSLAGAWKIDPAKSNFIAGSASLSIARDAPGMDKSSGPFLVVSDDGNVYLATAETMREAASAGIKIAEYSRAQSGKLLLIGTNARRDDICSFRCQSGLMERSLTLRFTSVDGAEHLMGEMLAFKSPKP